MATIYKFQDSEVAASSTTTNVLKASDPVLVYSANTALGHAAQATVGSISSLWSVSTSSSTATSATLPYGVNILSATAASYWSLSTAQAYGQCVTLWFNSTSTSSAQGVITASTANMSFASTETNNGIAITFNQVGRAYVELTAGPPVAGTASTGLAQWLITGRSAAGVLCT